MGALSGWLDSFFLSGYSTISIAGVPLPPETNLNFASGATGSDVPTTGSTSIIVSGGGGSTSTPQRLSYSAVAQQIAISAAGIEQWVIVNCSGGSPVLQMPTGCVDGQLLRVTDTRSGLAGTWGAGKVPILSVAASTYIENPDNLGTFVEASTVSPPAVPGNSVVYAWDLSAASWSVQ